ncbi:hypothetical protein DITRI_Ditri09bG0076500 [Diplodiscus trichospermus]
MTINVPNKVGMFLLYAPTFLVGLASFWLFPDADIRILFLKSAITIHFFKRILEVLFLHKYSGGMSLYNCRLFVGIYLAISSCLIYTQALTEVVPEPSIDLKYHGIVLFLVGISGNFYHHYILSKPSIDLKYHGIVLFLLRAKGNNDYKIPKGGLFEVVICPHYMFEILGFFGFSLISQTLFHFLSVWALLLYLMCRSYVTRKWYISKFEDFPKDVKALIPYVF